MTEASGWELASRDALRRRRHREFLALSFREKLAIVEQLGDVAAYFEARRRARGLPVRQASHDGDR